MGFRGALTMTSIEQELNEIRISLLGASAHPPEERDAIDNDAAEKLRVIIVNLGNDTQ